MRTSRAVSGIHLRARLQLAGGHLECLKYAHEQGCELDADTCKAAARRGHLDCLKYAHEQGCEWDADTCSATV